MQTSFLPIKLESSFDMSVHNMKPASNVVYFAFQNNASSVFPKDQTNSLLSLYHHYLLLLELHSLQSLQVKPPKIQALFPQVSSFPPSSLFAPSSSLLPPSSSFHSSSSPPPSSSLLPHSSSPSLHSNGKLSPEERRNKILKYKGKLRKWRENHPISRGFVGRKLVARSKPRFKGKFVKQSVVENKKIRKD